MFLLLVLASSFTLTDKLHYSYKHPNGQIAFISKYYDSCNCTIDKGFYENGQLNHISRTNSKNETDGAILNFFKNGDTSHFTYYLANQPNGRSFWRYANKQIAQEAFYDIGKRIGTWSDYDTTGNLERKTIYTAPYKLNFSEDYNAKVHWYTKGTLFLTQEISDGKINKRIFTNPTLAKTDSIYKHLSGKFLYQRNCRSCHSLYKDGTGPALSGLLARRDTVWVRKFIRNSAQLIASGDSLANEVYKSWGKTAMTSFIGLSKDEMQSLLFYIGEL